LEAKIAETEYERVSRSVGETVRADPEIGNFDQQVFIRDDPSWSALLREARVFFVARDDDFYVFGMGSDPFEDDVMGFVSYRHVPHGELELELCLPEHKEIPCGRCIANIGNDWFLDYGWWPDPVLPDENDAYLNGEMSEDEFYALQDEALTKCTADGYSKIGYETDLTD
jgi:hypothetical protein